MKKMTNENKVCGSKISSTMSRLDFSDQSDSEASYLRKDPLFCVEFRGIINNY